MAAGSSWSRKGCRQRSSPSLLLIQLFHALAAAASFSTSPTVTGTGASLDYNYANKHHGSSLPSPSITEAPHLLQKRTTTTVSPNTCGWVNGTAGSAIYCEPSRTCMFYAPTSATLPGMAGCCSASDYASCNWRRTCYASTNLGSTCTDAACLSDAFVLRCSNSTAPVCASWTYPAIGARDFACTQTAGNWTTMLGTAVDDFFSVPETYAVDVVWAPETAVVAATSETAASTGAAGGAETTAAGAEETGDAGGGGTPVGAIVGGVIGGVVGLALVVGAVVVFCCLAKKRRRNGAQQIPDGMVHEADNHASVSNHAAEVHSQSSRHVVELENMGRQRPVEMPGESKAYELE